MAPVPGRFQILALDGGGYKGMFAAAVLANLEKDLGLAVADHFDLVAGTSTGGIIALAMGAGLAPAEVVDFYADHGPRLFRFRRARVPRQVLRAKYSARPLRAALEGVLGERLFGESRLRLVIPSYDLRADKTYLFRTDHVPHLNRDWRETMVDVALATSAAPTFLPVHRLRGLRLVDGGLWANNPSLVALTEAVCFLGADLGDVRVFSLGTTIDVKVRPRRLDRGGVVAWAGDVTDVILRGQSLGASNAVKNLVGEARWLRSDPTVPDKVLRLDGVTVDELMGRAETESREVAKHFSTMFADHRGTPHVSPHHDKESHTDVRDR
jgi:predicted acylesterase/phospholipase RssA